MPKEGRADRHYEIETRLSAHRLSVALMMRFGRSLIGGRIEPSAKKPAGWPRRALRLFEL